MISVKCPACGLVDWNVGDCKRCGTPLAGLGADDGGPGYVTGVSEWAADARAVRKARRVMTVCGAVVLALVALGALYVANKPAKKQWFWSLYRKDPTVAEIFAHNLEVSGGAERIRKLRSFRAEGRLKFVGGEMAQVAAAAGAQVTFVLHAKEPDKVVTEIEIGPPTRKTDAARAQELAIKDLPCLGPGPCGLGAPEIRLSLRRGFDGQRGWEYVERTILTPGSTVPVKQYSSRELDGDALERMKRSSQMTGISPLDDKYTSLRLTGREPVKWVAADAAGYAGLEWDAGLRGHEAYVVGGVSREGGDETLYFDTLTGLLLRVDFETEDEEGDVVKFECYFGDYKGVGGLKLPHRLHFKRDEEAMTMTFEKYFPNDPIPDSTFEPPEPTE
jgi:hypothetical protein